MAGNPGDKDPKKKGKVETDPVEKLLNYLHYREMRGKTDSLSLRKFNNYGYVGAFQMGNSAMQGVGLLKKGKLTGKNQEERTLDANNWVGGAEARDAFLGSYTLQRKAAKTLATRNYDVVKGTLRDKGIVDENDIAAYLSAAHLLGATGVKEHLTGENTTRVDGNGTSLDNYVSGYYKWTKKNPEVKEIADTAPKSTITDIEPVDLDPKWLGYQRSSYNKQQTPQPPQIEQPAEQGKSTIPDWTLPGLPKPAVEEPTFTNYITPQPENKQLHKKYQKAMGGYLNEQLAMGGDIGLSSYNKEVNEFNSGDTHENSPYGGIPIGEGKTVEKDEVSFNFKTGKFIFSNRIRYDQ